MAVTPSRPHHRMMTISRCVKPFSIPGRGKDFFFFLFATAYRPALGPTQPPIQGVLGLFSRGIIKWPGSEGDHSSESSAEVKNVWSYTSTHPYIFMAWCLVKHRDNFTYTFIDKVK
jgi:hypothetical protein